MYDNEALIDKKHLLEERLDRIKIDLRQRLSADSEERAVELENQDVLLEIAHVTKAELEAVNAKLNGVSL